MTDRARRRRVFRRRRRRKGKQRHAPGPLISVRRVGGERPAGAPELRSNHRVAAEGAPRAGKCFSDAHSAAGMRHERQGEGVLAWTLIDAAREAMMSVLKYPAEKASRLALCGRSSHAGHKFNKSATPTAELVRPVHPVRAAVWACLAGRRIRFARATGSSTARWITAGGDRRVARRHK